MAVIKYSYVGSGTYFKDNQSDSLLFLGKYSVWFCTVVTGVMLNHATGFGLKISSVYQFYGHQAYIERLKNNLL